MREHESHRRHEDLDVRPPEGRRGSSARQAFVVGVIAIAGAALLNAETLLESAERQPFGWQRDVLVGLAKPVDRIARTLQLERPGEVFDDVRGRNDDTGHGFDELAETLGSTTSLPVAPTSITATPTTVTPTTAAPSTVTPTTVLQVRHPSADRPLTLWIGGDSMSHTFGQELSRLSGETGVIAPTLDSRSSTGLTRPDYFDWPAELVKVVERDHPEVMVLMFGANDAQRMQLGGAIYDVEDPEWQVEYRRRVALVMDYLNRDGRVIVWVGQPVMRSDRQSRRMAILNSIYREEADRRGIAYVDSWALFAAPDGTYSERLDDGSGRLVVMRTEDGGHLSTAGGTRLAKPVLALIESLYGE